MALSAPYHPIVVYFYHHLIKILDAFAQYSENKSFTLILTTMVSKFSKYWWTLSIIFGLAVIIDPCLKQLYLLNRYGAIYNDISLDIHTSQINIIITTFKVLFDEYINELGVNSK